jgi:ketosteroid isomerase-like protein
MSPNAQIVRDCFTAYETGDRSLVEALLAEDFRFSSPADVDIDRARYFERCWPNSGALAAFNLVRVIEDGDEVVVTYEAERNDGSRFRNTEIHTVAGGKLRRVEVYFGWNL